MSRFSLAFVAVTVSLGAGPVLAPDSDPVLAVRANKALAADSALAGLPLTVDVVNRVAVVGGPVPDLAVVPKIETVLAKVPGLAEVKVTCWTASAADPLLKRVGDKLRKPPAVPAPPAKPELPPLSLGSTLAEPARSGGSPPPLVAARPPAPVPSVPPAPPQPAPDHQPGVTVTRYGPGQADPPRRTDSPGWLEPPVAPRPGAAPAGDAVSAAVAGLVRSDARFRRLRADTSPAGVVTVTGKARATGDVFDFATLARKLPGVTRVVVGRVAAD